jgi:hypothetical protein
MNDTEAPHTTVPSARAAGSANLPAEDVARLAYERFVARGQQHGHDIDDWLAAEQELRQRHAGPPDPMSTSDRRAPLKVRARGRAKDSSAKRADRIVDRPAENSRQ